MAKKYEVVLTRTVVQRRRFEVSAPSNAEAKTTALAMAGDESFANGTTSDPDYAVESVAEIVAGPQLSVVTQSAHDQLAKIKKQLLEQLHGLVVEYGANRNDIGSGSIDGVDYLELKLPSDQIRIGTTILIGAYIEADQLSLDVDNLNDPGDQAIPQGDPYPVAVEEYDTEQLMSIVEAFERSTRERRDMGQLGMLVRDLPLGTRFQRAMVRMNVVTVRQLIEKTADDLLGCRYFGRASLRKTQQALEKLGLYLNGESP